LIQLFQSHEYFFNQAVRQVRILFSAFADLRPMLYLTCDRPVIDAAVFSRFIEQFW
jgi:hypothetical protein